MGKNTNSLITLVVVLLLVLGVAGYMLWRNRKSHKPHHYTCMFQITGLMDDSNIPKIFGKMNEHHEVPKHVTITSLSGDGTDTINAALQGISLPVTAVGYENDTFFLAVTLPADASFPATMLPASGCAALS